MSAAAIAKPRLSHSMDDASAGEAPPLKRIFIVEDEKVLADNLEELLQSMGYAVAHKASSGEDAVEQVARMQPDLVLMDIRLQGKMDGIEAAQIIAGKHGIPIVYLTAHSDQMIQDRIHETTPFGYLLKPFDEGELHIVIEIALQRGSAEEKMKKLNLVLLKALAQIKTPGGLVTVCAWCKKVHGEAAGWMQFEDYLTSHSSAQLTHGICPDCTAMVRKSPL